MCIGNSNCSGAGREGGVGVGAISIYWKNSNPFALLNYTGVDIKRVFSKIENLY